MRVIKPKHYYSRTDFNAAQKQAVADHNAAHAAEMAKPKGRWITSNADFYARGRRRFRHAPDSAIGVDRIETAQSRRSLRTAKLIHWRSQMLLAGQSL